MKNLKFCTLFLPLFLLFPSCKKDLNVQPIEAFSDVAEIKIVDGVYEFHVDPKKLMEKSGKRHHPTLRSSSTIKLGGYNYSGSYTGGIGIFHNGTQIGYTTQPVNWLAFVPVTSDGVHIVNTTHDFSAPGEFDHYAYTSIPDKCTSRDIRLSEMTFKYEIDNGEVVDCWSTFGF